MNIIRHLIKTLLLILTGTVGFLEVASAQEKDQDIVIKDLVASGNYVFEAQTAMPLRGPVRQLTFGYDLRISKDSMNSYLPYFGRAFVAPINPSEAGLTFTSTNFDYSVKPRRKGGWDVAIQTKDQRDNKRMLLQIQETGNASLQVNSNDRQPISFSGVITEMKQK